MGVFPTARSAADIIAAVFATGVVPELRWCGFRSISSSTLANRADTVRTGNSEHLRLRRVGIENHRGIVARWALARR